MKRRDFLAGAVTGLVAGTAGGYVVSRGRRATTDLTSLSSAPAILSGRQEWRMATTWPDKFPGIGTGAERLARRISEMSEGRLTVVVYSQGKLVPPFGTFDAVSQGTIEMGHGAAYYWQSRSRACSFFSAVPFGFTATELSAWMRHGGGQELYDELYAGFDLKPFLAGNTGAQMGGWFTRPLRSAADLKSLKMRMPGLGGEVLRRVGATAVNLPGSDILQALQSGAIDSTEWIGPWSDLAFGFQQVAKHYYWPGFHEPGTGVEMIVNRSKFEALPRDLQAVVANACQAETNAMLAEFNARNGDALKTLVEEHGVQLHQFPEDILAAFGKGSQSVLAEFETADDMTRRIYDSFKHFRNGVLPWSKIADQGYMNMRAKSLGLG
jgi:TRAP-type mannitol/chloroaromatic compound transport system substrate-binding protein